MLDRLGDVRRKRARIGELGRRGFERIAWPIEVLVLANEGTTHA